MQLKLFILPVKNLDAAEAEMNAFLRSHRVLTVKKELVADGENEDLTESWQDRIIYWKEEAIGSWRDGGMY